MKTLFGLGQLSLLSLALLASFKTVVRAQDAIVLKNPIWTLAIETTTLRVTAEVTGRAPVTLSAAEPRAKSIIDLKYTSTNASWQIPASGVSVSFQLEGDTLEVRF